MTGSHAALEGFVGLKTNEQNTREPNIMKTNYLSAPVTILNPSLVVIAAWDSRSPSTPQKKTKVRGVGFAFLLAALLGSCVMTQLHAQVVVVPNAQATNDGNARATTPAGAASVRAM